MQIKIVDHTSELTATLFKALFIIVSNAIALTKQQPIKLSHYGVKLRVDIFSNKSFPTVSNEAGAAHICV